MTVTLPELTRSPLVNLRDLGGIPAQTQRTRPGVVWRSDDVSLLDEDSAAELLDQGLQSVIDLRSLAEIRLTGRGVLAAHPVSYHHIPFLTSVRESVPAGEDALHQAGFGQMYINLFTRAAPQIVSALAVIAHAPGTVVFHCAAGQDRTGVLAAALLLTLDAGREEIVADYLRTGENSEAIRRRIAPVIGPLLAEMGLDLDESARAALRADFSPAPMLGLLDHLAGAYPDPLAPLRQAGLTAGLVAQLKEKVLH